VNHKGAKKMTPFQVGLLGGIFFGFWAGIFFIGLLIMAKGNRNPFKNRNALKRSA
jgi:hypothetical protein